MKLPKCLAVACFTLLTVTTAWAQKDIRYNLNEAKVAPGFYLAPNGYEFQLPQYDLTITMPPQSYYKVPFLLKHNAYLVTNDSVVSYCLYKYYLNYRFVDFALFGSYSGNMRLKVTDLGDGTAVDDFLKNIKEQKGYKTHRALRTPFAAFNHYSYPNDSGEGRVHGFYYTTDKELIQMLVMPVESGQMDEFEKIIKTLRKVDLRYKRDDFLTMLSCLPTTVEEEFDREEEETYEVQYAQESEASRILSSVVGTQPSDNTTASPDIRQSAQSTATVPESKPNNASSALKAEVASELASMARASLANSSNTTSTNVAVKKHDPKPVLVEEPTELIVEVEGAIKRENFETEEFLAQLTDNAGVADLDMDISQPSDITTSLKGGYAPSFVEVEKKIAVPKPEETEQPVIVAEVLNTEEIKKAEQGEVPAAEESKPERVVNNQPEIEVAIVVPQQEDEGVTVLLAENTMAGQNETAEEEIIAAEEKAVITTATEPASIKESRTAAIEEPVVGRAEVVQEEPAAVPVVKTEEPEEVVIEQTPEDRVYIKVPETAIVLAAKEEPVVGRAEVVQEEPAAVPVVTTEEPETAKEPEEVVVEQTPEDRVYIKVPETAIVLAAKEEPTSEAQISPSTQEKVSIQEPVVSRVETPVEQVIPVVETEEPEAAKEVDAIVVEQTPEDKVYIKIPETNIVLKDRVEPTPEVSAPKERVVASEPKKEVRTLRPTCDRKVVDPQVLVATVESMPYQKVEVKPLFNGGGLNQFTDWIEGQVCYPSTLSEAVEGFVTVKITIDSKGVICDAIILSSPHALLENEILHLLAEAPGWTPAMQGGQPVAVSLVLPIAVSQYM